MKLADMLVALTGGGFGHRLEASVNRATDEAIRIKSEQGRISRSEAVRRLLAAGIAADANLARAAIDAARDAR